MNMSITDTAKLIIWINQFDPFVQANDAAARIWHHSMSPLTYAEAEMAVEQHYRQNPGVKAEPGAILRRALQIRSSSQAGLRAAAVADAIEAPREPWELQQQNATDGNLIKSWRQRNPERWKELMEQGAADRRADLEARGRPSHFPGRAA